MWKAGKPILRWLFETLSCLNLHPYGLHLLHIMITGCIMGRDLVKISYITYFCQSKLLIISSTLLSKPLLDPFSPSFGHKLQHEQENGAWGFFLRPTSMLYGSVFSPSVNEHFACCFYVFYPILCSTHQEPGILTYTNTRWHPKNILCAMLCRLLRKGHSMESTVLF